MKHKSKEKPKSDITEKPEHKKPKVKNNDLDKLRAEIDNLQNEKVELFAKLQRISADYDNLQKRTTGRFPRRLSTKKR